VFWPKRQSLLANKQPRRWRVCFEAKIRNWFILLAKFRLLETQRVLESTFIVQGLNEWNFKQISAGHWHYSFGTSPKAESSSFFWGYANKWRRICLTSCQDVHLLLGSLSSWILSPCPIYRLPLEHKVAVAKANCMASKQHTKVFPARQPRWKLVHCKNSIRAKQTELRHAREFLRWVF